MTTQYQLCHHEMIEELVTDISELWDYTVHSCSFVWPHFNNLVVASLSHLILTFLVQSAKEVYPLDVQA
jgi:hypothetical protein